MGYSRWVNRPHAYSLNPVVSVSDAFTISKGNPYLIPELTDDLFLEYALQFKGNFVSSRFFFNNTTDAISNLVFINDTGSFEFQKQNLGTIRQFGFQLTGTVRVGIVTLNPTFRLYRLNTYSNDLASLYMIKDRQKAGFESGLSTIISLKKEFSVSFLVQYATPKPTIQESTFCDAFYMLTIEKTFKHKIKLGMVSAIPMKIICLSRIRNYCLRFSLQLQRNSQCTFISGMVQTQLPVQHRI
ncbi:MAG: TonB-dependent receptor [Bacteroidales bacterium]|nr:TonB-dependent receptor [Bacteroidales bacterium]